MARLVRIFTHPACAGCGPVVKMAWDIATPELEIDLRTVALETKEGLAEAQQEHIKTIPTLIVSVDGVEITRLVGTPTSEKMAEALIG